MTRIGLVVAVALTIAACSGSDTAVAPLETPASSTVVPAPTTEATPTTSTTTSVAETTTSTTTTVPETTTTFLEVEVEVEVEDSLPSDDELEPVFEDAFAAYAEIFQIIRSAFRDPENGLIRDQLRVLIEPSSFEDLGVAFDLAIADGTVSGGLIDDDRVELTRRGTALPNGGFVEFEVCKVLTSPVFDAATGEPVYEGEDAFRSRVTMTKVADQWILRGDVSEEQFVGTECL
jgi:hypothetical protein